ncbi:hypothetical protein GPECTOR_1g738 [Gonium pectorale]|uniref:Uncharacterized protein n=1 Tax=Gonium pectorale TaxID=33097 RepID=A0A150H3V1_GONPE|nr:hypothetical protein GPECTOR_1g738 [Gonium pectorale]|eukprot:KXZ56819.1 hypothetical protein GPECTOR_1g738 [Gonium pectorale]
MIYACESLAELDVVLYKTRKRLRPACIGAAMVKLEALARYERSSPYAHKVQRIADELEKYVETFADRLSLSQIANVVRGMSSVRHRLPPELLVRLAAGVVGDGGTALRYAPDTDLRDLAFGFAGQGFVNPLFWSRLGTALLPRLPSLDPNTLPALLRGLAAAQQLDAPAPASASAPSSAPAAGGAPEPAAPAFPTAPSSTPQVAAAREGLRLMCRSLDLLLPARLAEAGLVVAQLGPALGLAAGPELVGALEAAAARALPSLGPAQLSNLLLSLLALRRAAGLAPAALPAGLAAAAVPHLAAAAPALQLLHVKRALEALGPSLAMAAEQQPPAELAALDPPAPLLLDVLARRALQLLPAGAGGQGALPLSRGQLARPPRGGKDAAAVVAAAAGPAAPLDVGVLGLADGLLRAFAAASPAVRSVPGGDTGSLGLGSGVRALSAAVGRLAVEAQGRGLLAASLAASLSRSLASLGAEEAATALLGASGPAQVVAV